MRRAFLPKIGAFHSCVSVVSAAVLSAAGPLGCTLRAAPERERLVIASAGAEALDRLPLVPRLSLRAPFTVRPSDVWLLRGHVSDKELAQVLASAPSEALAAKRVPLSAWISGDALALAPLVVLEPSQEYSLVSLSVGQLAELGTAPSQVSIWWRWGRGAVGPGGWVIHCAEPPPWVAPRVVPAPSVVHPLPLGRRTLEPTGVEVEILAGFSERTTPDGSGGTGSDGTDSGGSGPAAAAAPSCVRFQIPADLAPGRAPEGSEMLLPPHELGGLYFEPTPIPIDRGQGSAEPPVPTIRTLGSGAFLDLPAALVELSLAPSGEGSLDASRLLVRAQVDAPSSLLLGQFPRGSYAADVTLIDRLGGLGSYALEFEVAQEQGHPVLSEVLGNPLGPEPESEWVEIVNIGRAPLALEGFRLEDSGGSALLPAVVLPAGGVGVIVRSDFVAGSAGDVVPAATALPIVVAELGDGGLSNSGEALRLLAPSGVVLSAIPKLTTKEGTSLARRHLLSPDWDSSFAPHAAPGASPGLANTFEE